MKITLNGGELDCSLEAEESVGAVLVSLDEWLESQGLIMTGVSADGRDLGQDIPSLKDLPVASVGTLDISAAGSGAWRSQALSALSGYASRAAAEGGAPLSEADSLRSTYAGLLDADELSLLDFVLDRARAGAPSPALRSDWARLAGILSGRLAELSDPRAAMARIIEAYASGRQAISSIPVLLQTSRDREAMEELGRFAGLFSDTLRLLPLLRGAGVELPSAYGEWEAEGFYADLNGALKELMGGLEDRDTVLIGDLCEYEILPRLDALFSGLGASLGKGDAP